MRRSLLITADFPPIVSGISTVFFNTWKFIDRDKTTILAPRVDGCLEFDSLCDMNIIRRRFFLGDGMLARILRVIAVYFYARSILVKEKYDRLVCGQPMIIGVICRLLKKQFGIDYHVWVYGGEIIKFQHSGFLMKVLTSVLDDSEYIFVNSSYTRQIYSDFGIDENKIIMVTPAVDTDVFRPGLKIDDLVDKHSLSGKKVLLTVSRLVPRKGHDVVLKALAVLVREIEDIVYVITGNGPDKERLTGLVKEYGLEKNVLFVGFVSDADLPRYYNLCNLYVMPNRQTSDFDTIEGFGLSFIEAGACAKPVIGGISGGSCDSVADNHTGFLVDPENIDDLTEKIRMLLTNVSKAAEMGRNGRVRAEKEFQWSAKAGQVTECMKKGL